jgi:hypothetical protein
MGEKPPNFLHCFEKMFTRVGKFTQKKSTGYHLYSPLYVINDIFKKPCLHFALLDDDTLISIQDTKEEGTDVDKAWKH